MSLPWHHDKNTPPEFRDLNTVFALTGEQITKDSFSELIKVEIQGNYYYVKRYVARGRNLRRHFGRSRVRAEWENILYFQQLSIKTPTLIAYGEECRRSSKYRGALITAELPNTRDLRSLAKHKHPLWKELQWVDQIITQVADFTAKLHQHQFHHGDLRWRNILISLEKTPQAYFLDCPMGRVKKRIFFRRGRLKDFVSLYKPAKRYLSDSQCLRFYLQYSRHEKLIDADKRFIKRVKTFIPSAKRWRRILP